MRKQQESSEQAMSNFLAQLDQSLFNATKIQHECSK
jgi:hypothetical protein